MEEEVKWRRTRRTRRRTGNGSFRVRRKLVASVIVSPGTSLSPHRRRVAVCVIAVVGCYPWRIGRFRAAV